METKIISSYDCLVVDGTNQMSLSKGQVLSLENDCVLSIYPLSSGKPSFNLDTREEEDNRFYKILTYQDKIFYLTNGLDCHNYKIFQTTLNDSVCTIELGQKSVDITYQQFKKKLLLNKPYEKYECGTMQDFVYVLLTNMQTQTLLLFNGKIGSLTAFDGEEIRLSQNGFSLTQSLQNIARHIIKRRYILQNDNIVEQECQIDYQNGRPIICSAAQTVCYAFLQAIQVEDFELASSYLDLPLKRRIDKEHLAQFFGKIKDFFPLDYFTFGVLTPEETSVYSFTLDDNKISDIDKK